MRRRLAADPVVADDDVPWALALGRCIEVWGDPTNLGYDLYITAFTGYSRAKGEFIDTLGLPRNYHYSLLPERLRKAGGAPWSIVDLAKRDPGRLAAKLANAGLPADWRPER